MTDGKKYRTKRVDSEGNVEKAPRSSKAEVKAMGGTIAGNGKVRRVRVELPPHAANPNIPSLTRNHVARGGSDHVQHVGKTKSKRTDALPGLLRLLLTPALAWAVVLGGWSTSSIL
jgi:hypothetical protein